MSDRPTISVNGVELVEIATGRFRFPGEPADVTEGSLVELTPAEVREFFRPPIHTPIRFELVKPGEEYV